MEIPNDIDPKAKVYVKHLIEVNKQLNDQLEKVKQEYSNSLNQIPDLQKAYQEINELKSKVYEVQSENDDLQQRLDISLKANEDLKKSNANSSNSSNIVEYERQIIDLKNQISKNKENKDNDEKNFKKAINDYEIELSREQAQNKLCNVLNSKLLNAAEMHFSRHFDDIKDLTQFLMQSPKNITKDDIDAKNEEISNLNIEIKKLKDKIKTEKQSMKNLQIGALKIKHQNEADQMQCNQKIMELENVNAQQQNEIKRLMLLNEQKSIDDQFIPNMKDEFVQVTLTDADTFNRMKEELELATTQIEEKDDHIRGLNKNIEELNNKLKDNEVQRKKLISKLKSLQDQTETLQKQIQNKKRKNKELKQNKLQLMQGIDLPPTSIRLRMENEIASLKHENEVLTQSKEKLEHLMEDQNKEIKELGTIKFELMSVIEKQSSLFNVFDELIQKQAPPPPSVVEKEIPVEPKFKWDFGSLPDEVLELVVGISENDGLSTELKVKNIFIVINKWIDNQNNSNDESQHSLQEKLNKEEEAHKHLKQCVIEAIGPDENDEENDNANLESRIKEFCEKSREQENQLSKILNEDQELFNFTQCDSIAAVCEKFKQLDEEVKSLSEQLKDEKNKRNALHQRATKVLSIKEHEFNHKEKSLTKMNDDSRNQINMLQEQVEQLSTQNQKLIDEINSLNSTHSDHMDEFEKHRHALLENSENQTRTIDNLSNEIEILKKDVAKWKKAAQLLEEEVNHQKKINLDMKKQYEDQIEEMINENEKQKSEMQKQIQNLELTLSLENDKNQKEIQSLNNKLEEKESQLQQTSQKLKLSRLEIEKVQFNANSKVEACERSIKLSETKYMAKILSLESNHANSMEEEKRKGEKEKRNLIDYFIKNFSKYTDIKNCKIDEDNYYHTIKAVKDELDKFESRDTAIRKLVNAKDDETTEDAFTQYVIKTKF